MKQTTLFTLKIRDYAYAFLLAFFTTAITSLITILDAGTLPNKEQLLFASKSGLITAISYLIKNIFSNSKGQFAKKEPNDAITSNGFYANNGMQPTKKN